MASLSVTKGSNQGTTYSLRADRTILGRNADCHVVINVPAVSREHALIQFVNDQYYIEDLGSRNKTYVNDEPLEPNRRRRLSDQDTIRICDTIFHFLESSNKIPLPPEWAPGGQGEAEDFEDSGSSTVEATLSPSSRQLLQAQPAERLAMIMEIAAELAQTLDLKKLLPKVVDNLFKVFKQADRCFVIFVDDLDANKFQIQEVRTRRGDETMARFSRTIVRNCVDKREALLSEDASTDARLKNLSQSITDFRIRSVMVAPLISLVGGRAFGVIQLDTQDRTKKFTEDDLKLLVAVAGQAAIAVDNARMHQTLIARAMVDRDLKTAHEVQLGFLPKSFPKVPGYTFAAHYESALEVGGDYYDFIPLPGGRIAAMIGDVAGKGVSAALLMSRVSSDARFTMLTEPNLAKAITRLNVLMQQAGAFDRFVTLEAAVLDPEHNEVTVVNAGHNPPIICEANGGCREAFPHTQGGFPLGVVDEFEYEVCAKVVLTPGDLVLMFSDGVTESPNAAGHEFNLKGVYAALKTGPVTPAELVPRLVAAVKQHTLGQKQHDDITVVCFGRDR
jgi:serine phosphatase RsbU (regulator of sigma subunit)